MGEEIGTDSEKEKDGRFTSIVTSLRKRKDQRKEQKEEGCKLWWGGGREVRVTGSCS